MSVLDDALKDARIIYEPTRKQLIKNLFFELMLETWYELPAEHRLSDFSELLREKVSNL